MSLQIRLFSLVGCSSSVVLSAVFFFAATCIPIATKAADTKTTLGTVSGNQIGVSLSSYDYEEPSINVSINATKIGIDYSKTISFGNNFFVKGDARFADGKGHYSGSGKKTGTDWYLETRALLGFDINIRSDVLSPFAGLGYRYLYNDLRGVTSTGSAGYRRESNYFYLPVGFSHHMAINGQARLKTTFEYDHLLSGRQYSKLSDTEGYNGISHAGNATNTQKSGYGLKLSMMYETATWSAGPYIDYWNISDSRNDTIAATKSGINYTVTVFEPKNRTTEIGIKFNYPF